VYHNDQWFYFIPPQSGRYYINVVNQKCKNIKGVQVLVIEGNPCKTDTYQLKHCTSFTDQNNTFIRLDSLVAGTEYLVNIDGFLGDQCDFNIQFSTKPLGFPDVLLNMDTLNLKNSIGEKVVALQWHASQDQLNKLSLFEVSRLKLNDKKSVILEHLPIRTNSLGKHVEKYEYIDSLNTEGTFIYRIIGIDKISEERYLMDDTRLEFRFTKPEIEKLKYVTIFPLDFPYKGNVEILIFDYSSDKFLTGTTVKDGRNTTFTLDLTQYVIAGYRYFYVKAKNLKSGNTIVRKFSINEVGELVQTN